MEDQAEYLNIQEQIIKKVSADLNRQLENFFIEGLKRKGFEFQNRADLLPFAMQNCTCFDDQDLKEKTYFVNNIPFLLHCYAPDFSQIEKLGEFNVHFNYGSITFL
jgi:hypothetical protein